MSESTFSSAVREVPFSRFNPAQAAEDFNAVYEGENLPAVSHSQVLNLILADLKPVKFQELGGFKEPTDVKQKHKVVLAIRELLKAVAQQQYGLARKNAFIFAYNGQYWKELDQDTLKDFIGKACAKIGVEELEAGHYEFVDKAYRQFLLAAHFDQVEGDPSRVLVNLRNGTFEITPEGQQLRAFCADDFLRHQLNFDYDPQATAPRFTAYLNRVLPEKELQEILAEFVGYVFTRDLKLERALLLYGSGANGKSVFFDVLNALLGSENISNFSLSDLMEEHNRAHIANKLLNYGSEMNAKVTRDTFKNLVSNEPIMARLKYGNSFTMRYYAKLCFNCNELPKDIEQTDAYFRRLIIVPFRQTIPDSEQDAELAQKIVAEELSGVFNWVLVGLKRLLANKRFTQSEIVKQAVADYRAESDSAACFLKESEPGDTVGLLKEVYANYRAYCLDSGLRPLGKLNFSRRLTAHGWIVTTGHARKTYVSKRE